MQRRYAAELYAFVFFFLSQNVPAQQSTAVPTRGTAVSGNVLLPARNVDLTRVEPLVGLPASTVVGYPQRCSIDGSTFLEVYAQSNKPDVSFFPDLYRVSELRDVKQIRRPLPLDYKQFTSRSFYPADHDLVTLIQASQPANPELKQIPGQKNFFLSITDRDGDHQKLVTLDLKFEPVKVAIFNSGEVLVLGIDTSNFLPVLALLHTDGSLDRVVDMDSRTYDFSQELNRIYPAKPGDSNTAERRRRVLGSLGSAQFVPWGSEILLVQPGSLLPIYRFLESGQQAAVTLKLPEGFLLESVLGSDEKDTWVIRTQSASSLQQLANSRIVENPPQQLLEVDPYSGEVIRQLEVKGPQPGEVSCAAKGKLSAIYYGAPEQSGVPDQLTFASASR